MKEKYFIRISSLSSRSFAVGSPPCYVRLSAVIVASSGAGESICPYLELLSIQPLGCNRPVNGASWSCSFSTEGHRALWSTSSSRQQGSRSTPKSRCSHEQPRCSGRSHRLLHIKTHFTEKYFRHPELLSRSLETRMRRNAKHKRVLHWLQALEISQLQWSRVDSAMCLAPTSLRSPRKISFLMTVIELRKPAVVFNYPFLSKHIGLISQCNVWYRWSQTTDTFITLSSLPPSILARIHEWSSEAAARVFA